MPRNAVARLPIVLALPLLAAAAFAEKEPITATDLLEIRTGSQIAIAPNGKQVAYVVTSMYDEEDETGYRRHLWLADLDSEAAPRQLTHGERRDRGPAWSPDGTRLAFVREHDDLSQVWILPLGGGEAYPVTNAEHGASGPTWSPDGKRIVYASEIPAWALEGPPPWAPERAGRTWRDAPNWRAEAHAKATAESEGDAEGTEAPASSTETEAPTPKADGSLAEIRAWLAKNASDDDPRVLTRLDFQGERGLADGLSFTHLFAIEARADAESTQLTQGYQDFYAPQWLPDGSALVVGSTAYPQHPDRVLDGDLWRVHADGSGSAPLLDWEGWTAVAPRISPDGTKIAFLASDASLPTYGINQLAVVSIEGSAPRRFDTAITHNVTSAPTWSADGEAVYVTTSTQGAVPLLRVVVSDASVETIVGGPRGVRDFDVAGDRLVFAATAVDNPWELYTAAVDGTEERRLTALNRDWLATKQIVRPTAHWLTRPDGTRVQYWVMKPAVASDAKIPTVLEIHGGPSAMWGPGEFTMWHEFQLLCAWGYGVVYSNPRGSGGYGQDFRQANYRDWGHGPAGDILAALDAATEANDWIDRDQLVVTGGSYAGYMTAWIVSQDHRFQAAVAQRGVYDLSFFFGEGNAWRLVPYHFGGYPWEAEARAALNANSPQTFAHQIRTPLLIIHSDQDLRTGVNQSEMLFKSLKVLERPVEYVRYPDEGHDLSRSGNPTRRMDRLNRIVEFFERYVSHP